jgi:hypothetical protein
MVSPAVGSLLQSSRGEELAQLLANLQVLTVTLSVPDDWPTVQSGVLSQLPNAPASTPPRRYRPQRRRR